MSFASRRIRLVALTGLIALAAAVAGGIATRPHAPAPAEAVTLTQAGPPGNDNFAQRWYFAPPISPPWSSILPFQGEQDAAGATLEPGEGAPCASITSTVWYGFQPDTGGNIVIDTAGSSYDTVLAVYVFDPNGTVVPSPPGDQLKALDCNDNASGVTSRVQFQAEPYAEYFIQVGAVGTAGAMRINAACDPACPPRNDNRDWAEYIGIDVYQPVFTTRVDTTAATTETWEPRDCGNAGKTIWYQFQPQSDQTLIFDTTGSNFGTTIAIYQDSSFDIPSPPGGLNLLACANGGATGQAKMTVDLKQYRGVWVQVGGFEGASGDLRFSIACDGPCPPYEDNFQGGYSSLPTEWGLPTTAGATIQPGERTDCGDMGHTVWFGVAAEGPTTLTIDTSNSDFDTSIAVYRDPQYTGQFDQLERVACDEGGAGQQAELRIDVQAQEPIYIQIGGRRGASGYLQLNVNCDPEPCPPPYDSQNNPNWLVVPSYLPRYDWIDTRGATEEPGEPLSCGDIGGTVWYFIESYATTRVQFATVNPTFATAIALYRVDDYDQFPGEQDRVACADGATQPAQLAFDVEQGQRYRVQLGGRNGARGETEVEITCLPACPPPNDNVAAAWPVIAPNSSTIDTRGATLEAGEPQPCGGSRNIGKTVWLWLAEAPMITDTNQVATWRITTAGSDFPVIVAVYENAGFSPPGAAMEVACGEGEVTVDVQRGSGRLVQIGGIDDRGGQLSIRVACSGACPETYPGGCQCGGPGGGIVGPDTGNGGYLGR